jgi:hypothetical protein
LAGDLLKHSQRSEGAKGGDDHANGHS